VGCGEGEAVALGDGEFLVLGDGKTLGLAAGEGDFLEMAAVRAMGAEHANAAMKAMMSWNLFFIGYGVDWSS
jgi:hypothetical protein